MVLYCAKTFLRESKYDLELLKESLHLFAELTEAEEILNMFSTDIIEILIHTLFKHSHQIEMLQPCLRAICNLTSSSNEILIKRLIQYDILDVFMSLIETP